jgi:ribose 5-phosphate isomerase RpiB
MADEIVVKELERVVVRFCGDSGDGMQLAGNIFSNLSAVLVNDISTFPENRKLHLLCLAGHEFLPDNQET